MMCIYIYKYMYIYIYTVNTKHIKPSITHLRFPPMCAPRLRRRPHLQTPGACAAAPPRGTSTPAIRWVATPQPMDPGDYSRVDLWWFVIVYDYLWWFMMVDDDSGLLCRLQVPFTGTNSLSRSVATYSCTSEVSSINQWPFLSLVFRTTSLVRNDPNLFPRRAAAQGGPQAPSPGLSAPHQTVCHPTDPFSPGGGIRNGTWLVGKSSFTDSVSLKPQSNPIETPSLRTDPIETLLKPH
jgi:hypothetical protein